MLVHLTASDGSECRMAVDNLVLICTRSLTARRHVHPACGQQCGAQLSSVLVLFSASGVSCLGVGRAVRIRHRARLRVLGVLSGVLGGVLGGCARPWHGGPCQSERRCARRCTHVSTCTQAGPGRDHTSRRASAPPRRAKCSSRRRIFMQIVVGRTSCNLVCRLNKKTVTSSPVYSCPTHRHFLTMFMP